MLSLVAGALALIAADFGVRRVYHDQLDRQTLQAAADQTRLSSFTEATNDTALLYRLSCGVNLTWNNVPLFTDAELPCRIPGPVAETPPADALRLAVVGDSTSFGWSVACQDAYPSQLQRRLENQLQVPVALRNFSVPGYNSDQQRVVVETWVLDWHPDVLLLHYDHNDVEPMIASKPVDFLDPATGDNPLGSAIWKLLQRRRLIARRTRRLASWQQGRHEMLGGYVASGPLYDDHLGSLRRIAEVCRGADIVLVAVVFDHTAELTPLDRNEHFQTLHVGLVPRLSEWGCQVVDLYPAYQALMRRHGWEDLSAWWIDPRDPHPNPDGHAFIAETVAAALAEKLAPLAARR